MAEKGRLFVSLTEDLNNMLFYTFRPVTSTIESEKENQCQCDYPMYFYRAFSKDALNQNTHKLIYRRNYRRYKV